MNAMHELCCGYIITCTLQLTELVQREVLRESAVEDQTSVLSYFIQTAKVLTDSSTVPNAQRLEG